MLKHDTKHIEQSRPRATRVRTGDLVLVCPRSGSVFYYLICSPVRFAHSGELHRDEEDCWMYFCSGRIIEFAPTQKFYKNMTEFAFSNGRRENWTVVGECRETFPLGEMLSISRGESP
jgi:hypothetical protein